MGRVTSGWAVRAVAALLVVCTASCAQAKSTLADISSVNDLKARFNADAGKPRIILLLSPT